MTASADESASETSSPTGGSGPEGSWEEVAAIDLDFDRVGEYAVEGRHVAVTHTAPGAGPEAQMTEVTVIDWQTQEVRHLHSNSYPSEEAFTSSLEIENGWVLFAEEDRLQFVGAEGAAWRLHSVPLAEGKQARVLRESAPGEVSWSPHPVGNDGRVVFGELEDPDDPRQGVHRYEWIPGDPDPLTVARRQKVNGFSPVPGGEWAAVETGAGPGTPFYLGEVYLQDEDGDREVFRDEAWTQFFDVDGEMIAWGERKVRPNGQPSPRTAAYHLWMARASDPEPVEVHAGFHRDIRASGAGFVSYLKGDTGTRIRVVWPGIDEPMPVGELINRNPSYDVDDDLIVYTTEEEDGLRLRVVRVTLAE